MKKLLALILIISLTSFKAGKKVQKTYTFSFTEAQVIQLFNVVEQSNAPHLTVKETLAGLEQQLRPQLDTLKK